MHRFLITDDAPGGKRTVKKNWSCWESEPTCRKEDSLEDFMQGKKEDEDVSSSS